MSTLPPRPPGPTPPSASGLSIAQVERETGLPKDTLRVWERRYGFPRPGRDGAGERVYSPQELQQLHLIRRLIDAGQRPGKIVGLDEPALRALLPASAPPVPAPEAEAAAPPPQAGPAGATPEEVEALLQAVASHAPQRLRHRLQLAQQRMGLARFVTGLLAPLNAAVGQAWAEGRFEVFEEHLYTEVVTGLLRQSIATLQSGPEELRPRVLLTTLSGEQHALGLLMVEALLGLQGAGCVSLGTQTPLADVVRAARAHRAEVVALSFSAVQPAAWVQQSLRELRALLPADTALWVGGACPALYPPPAPGIVALRQLDELATQLAHRAAAEAPSPAHPTDRPPAPRRSPASPVQEA